ncbi:hypothetical protein NMD88_00425 [Edwardsiella tarda]|uniref:hypothetical protein n=1 Tax=Edwardsiella tarda TaxID=636 RepID=UPI00351C65D9
MNMMISYQELVRTFLSITMIDEIKLTAQNENSRKMSNEMIDTPSQAHPAPQRGPNTRIPG